MTEYVTRLLRILAASSLHPAGSPILIAMGLGGAFFGGLVGGAIGAAIWVGVGYSTGAEVGWIAWGIGFLAGMGVKLGGGGRAGATGAVVAALLAITSIAVGKYAIVTFTLLQQLPVAAIADVVVMEHQKAGEYIEFPPGGDLTSLQEFYPPDIWAEARARFENMVPSDQEGLTAAVLEEEGGMDFSAFLGSFSPFDFVWLLLAIGTAAAMGASGADIEQGPPIKLLGPSTDGMAVLPPASKT